MNDFEMRAAELSLETRSLTAKIQKEEVTVDEGKKLLADIQQRRGVLEREMALANAPGKTETTESMRDVGKLMLEKRSVSLNGTGAISQVQELKKELQAKTPFLKEVRYFYGPNALTNIPVLSPGLATPAVVAEGTTGIAEDTKLTLGVTALTPRAWVSILPVTLESIKLGGVNIESELPGIFADSYARGFHNAFLTGDGTGLNPEGLFVSIPADNQTVCQNVGAPKIIDLVMLALTIADKTDYGAIIMNPGIYAQILADPTEGVAKVYKEELIRGKTIEGVRVILTSAAPSSISTGSTVAAAGVLSDYAVALASEITIDPIKVKGDTHTYFQAAVFANGKKTLAKNFYSLVTK